MTLMQLTARNVVGAEGKQPLEIVGPVWLSIPDIVLLEHFFDIQEHPLVPDQLRAEPKGSIVHVNTGGQSRAIRVDEPPEIIARLMEAYWVIPDEAVKDTVLDAVLSHDDFEHVCNDAGTDGACSQCGEMHEEPGTIVVKDGVGRTVGTIPEVDSDAYGNTLPTDGAETLKAAEARWAAEDAEYTGERLRNQETGFQAHGNSEDE